MEKSTVKCRNRPILPFKKRNASAIKQGRQANDAIVSAVISLKTNNTLEL